MQEPEQAARTAEELAESAISSCFSSVYFVEEGRRRSKCRSLGTKHVDGKRMWRLLGGSLHNVQNMRSDVQSIRERIQNKLTREAIHAGQFAEVIGVWWLKGDEWGLLAVV